MEDVLEVCEDRTIPANRCYSWMRRRSMFALLEGVRHVKVMDRNIELDYAQVLKDLLDTHFPAGDKSVLVQGNLSSHKRPSPYEASAPAEAGRLVDRFEWHFTPNYGSWLDMAEAELSVLSRHCLNRRIPNQQSLTVEVVAWQESRNKKGRIALHDNRCPYQAEEA